jgi:phenylacetic acid degradation operon negative regulatory protein
VDARSALVDLYGEHLLDRGGRAPVGALVRLLAPVGIAEPAVRTAVSRMSRQGWLAAVRVDGAPGYALTALSRAWLDERAERRAAGTRSWDGTWHLLVVTSPPGRTARERLQVGLRSLGYANLGEPGRTSTWVGAHESAAADALLAAENARAERFRARHDGDSQALIARAWDLEAIARSYRRFLERGEESAGRVGSDAEALARQLTLVRGWESFVTADPQLPAALLPPDWPGEKAADWLRAELAAVATRAARFVDASLARAGD